MTKGKCLYCSVEFKDSAMGAHLQSCSSRQKAANNENKEPVFLIKAAGKYRKGYWLFIEVKGSSTLKDIDSFLRDIWLECCGHLSCFKINDVEYHTDEYLRESMPPPQMKKLMKKALKESGMHFDIHEPQQKDMHIKLIDVLQPDISFSHEYDFGSATHLALQVIARFDSMHKGGKPIRLVARNNLPKFRCSSCNKASNSLCDECNMKGKRAYYCEPCLEKHPCGGDVAFSIVNSPRMGVCGYSGPDNEE